MENIDEQFNQAARSAENLQPIEMQLANVIVKTMGPGNPTERAYVKKFVAHPEDTDKVDGIFADLESRGLIRRVAKGEFGGQFDKHPEVLFVITQAGAETLIPQHITPETPAPEVEPDMLLPESEMNAWRDMMIANHPRIWLRLIREFNVIIKEKVDAVAGNLQAQIGQKNKLLAALVIMNRGPITIDPLAIRDTEHGTLAIQADSNGRPVMMFAPTDKDRHPKILISGDTNILKMVPPSKNGKGCRR